MSGTSFRLHLVVALAASVLSTASFAGEVGVLKEFVNGAKTDANEVNTNFTTLKGAVNDNHGRITTLTTTVGAKQNRVTGVCDTGKFVRSVNEDGTVVCGDEANSKFGDLSKELTGTVAIAATTRQVNGVGTFFIKELNVGDGLLIAGEKATVASITSDVVLRVDTNRSSGVVDVKAYTDNDLLTLKNGAGVTQSIIDKSGNLMRHIAYASGSLIDITDTGRIVSRSLQFKKRFGQETAMRIGYTDNFRVLGAAKACRWEIRVDGVSCPVRALTYDMYVHGATAGVLNIHVPGSVFGYCSGITPGVHEVQVWVSSHPQDPTFAGSDCYTGWGNTTWALEAEEVFVQ